MSEFDFLEPIPKTTVSVNLPSRGIPYRKDTPASSGKITMTPMTMVEEAIFAEGDLVHGVDRVLKRCIQDKLDVNTLISADKFFLFMMLRAITYGPSYTFAWNCDECKGKNESTVRIPDDFKVKQLADEDTEPYSIELPDSGKTLGFRLLRGHDEPMIDKYQSKIAAMKKQGIVMPDSTAIYRLARHIVSVDGNDIKDAPEEKLVKFVASLSAKDRQMLLAKINFYTPGLDTGVTLVCDHCSHVHDWDMPFTASFFRADVQDEGAAMDVEV